MTTAHTSGSIRVTPEGLQKVINRMAELEKDRDPYTKGWTQEDLVNKSGSSLSTVKRFLKGESISKPHVIWITGALNLDPLEVISPKEWNQDTGNLEIDWWEVCHRMLDNQQEQQRIRRKASEMGFEVNVHVPLGLVERKQQQRRDENVERGQVYQLEKEVITKTYEHNDFLEEVISQRSARKNKHVAIVGEPGAGKTTLLSAIASHIKDNTQHLPIFISLGSLQGMTLEDYLLKKWLPDAMRLVNPQFIPSSEIENQLITRFYQSGVWLLLDGVDEMGESSPVEALNKISRELTNCLGQARVVLTCRLNVWDASLNNNILPSFDTYKTQEFQPEQVNEFIDKWFKCAESIQQGEELKAKLIEPGKERIPELVINPLRLSLLCQIFYQNEEGELPETKAEFYEIFTRYFYEWKPELVPDVINSYQLKKELHQALGKLALAGINSDLKFRLKRSLAVEEMGEKLFKLAYDLGWLNQVDRDAVNDEDVYAFFHPNFQEYFAALIIDDWHYFLNHVPNNPEEGIYRIFEPQWKEVMLLWIGRKNVEKEQKESFLSTLIDLSNDCEFSYFYYEQPDFLGALLIVEFPNFSRSHEIVKNIVEYSFGYFDANNQRWEKSPLFIVKRAKEVLNLTNASHLVYALLNEREILLYAKEYMDKNIFSELSSDIFWTLNKVDHNNDFVINQIIHWIKEAEYWSNDDYDNPKTLPYDEIMTSNPDIINKLSEMLIKSYNSIIDKRRIEQIKKQIKENQVSQQNTDHHIKYDSSLMPNDVDTMLEKLNAYNAEEDRLNELVQLDENTLKIAKLFNTLTETLTRIAPNNQNIINLLINIFKKEWDNVNFDHDFCLKLVTSIDKVKANKQELIDFLNEKLLDNHFIDDYRHCCIAEYLLKIEPENHIAINILNKSLPKIKDDKMTLRIASALVETNTDNHEIINTLVRLLDDRKINEPQQNIRLDAKSLSNFLSDAESISNFLSKVTPEKVISCLAKMAYQCNDARIVLDDIFQNSQYIFLRENVAWRILELEPNNQEALIFLLGRYKNQDNSAQYFTEEAFIDFLREYPESINNFINVLRNCQDVNTSKLIIRLLREVSNENYQLEIVKILKEILNTTKNEGIIYEAISDCIAYLAVKELGTIANQNLNAINTLINIISHTNDNEIKIVGIKSLSKIGVGNLDVVNTLINLMKNPNESDNYRLIRKSLLQVMQGRLFAVAVAGLKDNFIGKDEDNDDYSYLLWHCAENMSYPDFYRAWYGESSPLQNLETQFTDIHSILSQLQPTDKTHPLVINLKSLQDETDTSAICQEICNQIYLTAFTENSEIPEVNNAPQLKRIIPQIKKQLQTQNIALIINNCKPNQIIITFCDKLRDVLHIAFITDQPLDPPLKGFPPNQPNLLNAIQSWINETAFLRK
ncbi:NACHT domain-containing protein [Nostoc sp. NOS(2021)]|uniref:NACHT C-terminal alpha/beta 1 domain-containing protein n=1 Tax=Nostoc sp. NOS(2021) TaxID=2815407 RepID=UPI0025F47972|nr:NACHT domain-containing protein [Nostoc sp. NOS(2021)]